VSLHAPRRARTRIALAGALLSAAFLVALALATRTALRKLTFDDIDEELETLSAAVGSGFELEGLDEVRRDALHVGLEANTFEFRIGRHSAILFNGETPVAVSGDLLRAGTPVGLGPYRGRPEKPYTAIEPYSGQGRRCRFLVTRLSGKAAGATLVLFRWIGPNLAALSRLDRALAAVVLVGFAGTAAILAFAVGRAIRPVEDITRLAEDLQATDLSRRVRADAGGEEFRRLASVINGLLDRIENAFRAQRRLVADAAHELKTPTAVLLGEAQEAARPQATRHERARSLETIERAARGLAREVDALLVLARGDAAPPPRRDRVDLARLAAEAVANVEPLGLARHVACRFEPRGELGVFGDAAGLRRVVANLVTNAMQYTAPGTEVEIELRREEGHAVLDVRDRGPGVAEADRARIFERFVRLEPARAENPEGAGLGLALVDQIVRAHAGAVEVLAREGGGAVFRVKIPEGPIRLVSEARGSG
jgi:signal transduction histidine kinase